MAFGKKPTVVAQSNLLQQKEVELERLVSRSNAAISVVTSTISSLEDVNNEIVSKIGEIEEYQKQLEATKSNLNATQTSNARIITNFKRLISE